MAIRNKLKDMDIELVINAGFYPGIGRETAKSFRGKVIAVQPSLVPAFETLRGVLMDVFARFNVVAFDLVELAPALDASGRSTALACKLLRECLLALET